MKPAYSPYIERFPEDFSVKHKISEHPEKKNFHLHKQMEIVFCLSSNLKCKFENGIIAQVPKGGIILFGSMDLHYMFTENGSGLCDRYVLYFSSDYISRFSTPEINLLECFFLKKSNQPAVLSIPETQQTELLRLLEKMDYCENPPEGAPPPYGGALLTRFLLGQFLLTVNQLYFSQYGGRSPSFHNHAELVYDIYEYIQKHYAESLSTDSIAKAFFISKTQLYNLFKEISGTTVTDYIQEFRLSRAKDFLINSELPIEIIGQSVGYDNLSSFCRAFKRQTALSPIQYRKKYADSGA